MLLRKTTKYAQTSRYTMKLSVANNPSQSILSSKGDYLLVKFQSTNTVKLQVVLDQGSSFNLLQFSGLCVPVYVCLVFRLPSSMLG